MPASCRSPSSSPASCPMVFSRELLDSERSLPCHGLTEDGSIGTLAEKDDRGYGFVGLACDRRELEGLLQQANVERPRRSGVTSRWATTNLPFSTTQVSTGTRALYETLELGRDCQSAGRLVLDDVQRHRV